MTRPSNHGILIIGASQAGVQLASSLREQGHAGPITVVGAETHPPYQRPPLSKALLHGELTTDSLLFRSNEFYAEQRIELALGERIPPSSGPPTAPGWRSPTAVAGSPSTGSR